MQLSKILERFPPGLEPLYERMMEQIQNGKDAELCIEILSMVTLASRPIYLRELVAITGLPEELSNDLQSLNDLVDRCGSFLTVQEEIIYFVHQSAKDYFKIGKGKHIFPLGLVDEHYKITRRSFQVMSDTLKRDICNIRMQDALISEMTNINREPLAHNATHSVRMLLLDRPFISSQPFPTGES